MANPLVAEAEETKSFDGIPIMESIDDTKKAIEKGDWAGTVMGAVGTGLDALGMAMDPFGSILAAGVGWLIEHVEPLSEALNALTGDDGEIKAHSETWKNVATELGEINTEMTNLVKNDTARWTGEAGDAYRKRSEDTATLIEAAKKAAEGASEGIGKAGMVVGAVRTLVRDIIAELVGHLVSWALQVLATAGIAMAWVVPQVVAAVAKVATKIADITGKLIKAMKALAPLLKKLGDGFGDAGKALKNIKNDSSKADGPASTNPASADGPGGKPGGDGARSGPGGPASTKSQNADTTPDRNVHSDPPSNNRGNAGSSSGPNTLSGANRWGFRRNFTPGDVKSIPLKDSSGKVVGVSFPSKRSDKQTVTQWAGSANRTSDRNYLKYYPKNDPSGKTQTRVPAPWNSPFYVHAHANPDQFAVKLKKKHFWETSGMRTITVDGATHGKIVTGNQHFQNASAANSNRDVVYMSCSAGSSSGNAAGSSTNVLRDAGHQGNVYAPTGTGVRETKGPDSNYGVEPDSAGGLGEFKRF